MSSWALSEERKTTESEALRMWPEDLHLGKFDGIIPQDQEKRMLLIQRQAYVIGERAAYCRTHPEEQLDITIDLH